MNTAHYSLIKYIADPGRNEALNVGLVIWDDDEYRVVVDEGAAARVTRETPWLPKDALHSIEPMIRDRIAPMGRFSPSNVERYLSAQRGYPVLLTEARFTAIDDDAESLDDTVREILARAVQPKRRYGGGRRSAVARLEKRLRPFIKVNSVERNHVFSRSRSGIPRSMHFYANSGADVAIDAVQFQLSKADDIRVRADAEAFKVWDITAVNEVRALVYCEFSPLEEFELVSSHARQSIETAGAKVVTTLDEAEAEIQSAVQRQKQLGL